MKHEGVSGIGGWLVVYLIGSIPLLMMYSMGLSGWFFEYPFGLMAAIFIVLAIPLVLVILKSPSAPRWNIKVLWLAAILMALRSISVFLFPMAAEGDPPLRGSDLVAVILTLAGIVSLSLGWATIWTRYFRESLRVKATFGRASG